MSGPVMVTQGLKEQERHTRCGRSSRQRCCGQQCIIAGPEVQVLPTKTYVTPLRAKDSLASQQAAKQRPLSQKARSWIYLSNNLRELGIEFFLRARKELQPWYISFDSSPVRPALALWTADTTAISLCYSNLPSLWQFVRAVIKTGVFK